MRQCVNRGDAILTLVKGSGLSTYVDSLELAIFGALGPSQPAGFVRSSHCHANVRCDAGAPDVHLPRWSPQASVPSGKLPRSVVSELRDIPGVHLAARGGFHPWLCVVEDPKVPVLTKIRSILRVFLSTQGIDPASPEWRLPPLRVDPAIDVTHPLWGPESFEPALMTAYLQAHAVSLPLVEHKRDGMFFRATCYHAPKDSARNFVAYSGREKRGQFPAHSELRLRGPRLLKQFALASLDDVIALALVGQRDPLEFLARFYGRAFVLLEPVTRNGLVAARVSLCRLARRDDDAPGVRYSVQGAVSEMVREGHLDRIFRDFRAVEDPFMKMIGAAA
jgi:hypothetical protein